ncbi:hypothetical protein [Pseudomonas viridiflava]
MSILESIGEIGKADKIYVKPRIPKDKARNAILAYAEDITYDDIIVLIDDTVFGNSKNGLIITETAIIGKESFSDSFHYSFKHKPDIFAKKGFTSVTLYVNDTKTIAFTQPSLNELILLFKKIDRYIKNTSKTNSIQAAPTSNATSAPAQIEFQASVSLLEQKTDSSTIIEASQATENKSTTNEQLLNQTRASPKASIFNRIEKDTMIGSIRTMKNVNSAFNFIGDMLSDKTTSSEQIRRETSSYFAKTILRVRTEYIEKNNVIGLMNNVATLESLIFAAGHLHLELTNRGVNSNALRYVLTEGIKHFLSLDNSRDSNNTIASLVAISSKMADSQEELYSLFYLRQVMSNSRREICDDKMGMDLLRKAASEQSALPFEDALHEAFMLTIMHSIEELGDITSDRNINYNVQKCVDVILDSTQAVWN